MLKSAVLTAFFLIVLTSYVLAADQYSPPNRLTITGLPCYVTFRWPDDGSMYYLEVLASGRSVYSRPASGSSLTLSLPANDYRWKVRKFYNGEYHEITDFQDFRVSADIAFSFNGSPGYQGADGGMGSRGWVTMDGRRQYANNGERGENGGNGSSGRDVTVILEDSGDYLKVVITCETDVKELYLSKSSRPLSISACGGRGGDGGSGGSGGVSDIVDRQEIYQKTLCPIAGDGGDGGNGGDGGKGGTVKVISRGGDFSRFIEAAVSGGEAGKGGQAGTGGNLGGQSGYPGCSGKTGESGKVVIEAQQGNTGNQIH